ncbi:MAG TPA: lysylphosphatidylglycerol synthase transmembrane domain-containing protein [Ktedonobacterales bacterium]|nr:lysylphosphatidylglycerol synthase transmembrane domain-containing protein [Ktedonobacterales bacterium]
MARIRTKVIVSLVFGLVVVAAISFYADLPSLLQAFRLFPWALLPAILGLTLLNYGLRFVKWDYYLHCLHLRVPRGMSLKIFIAGLSMAITPGKVGELLKPYLIKRYNGTPISRTAPVIVAERLTDGLAMLILAGGGLALYGIGWQGLLAILLAALALIGVIQYRPLALKLLSWGERLPVVRRFAQGLYAFYESAYVLLSFRPLLLAVGIGLVSWSGECVAFYLVLVGLGLPGTLTLLIQAAFILATSTLIGSVTGLPGGLGSADLSILGLIFALVTRDATIAGAATLLIRFCTLWFGVSIGVVGLLLFRGSWKGPASPERADNQNAASPEALAAVD